MTDEIDLLLLLYGMVVHGLSRDNAMQVVRRLRHRADQPLASSAHDAMEAFDVEYRRWLEATPPVAATS